MTTNKPFLVGFDRFITLQWAEFALNLAVHSSSEKEIQVKELKRYISAFMDGNIAIDKTANVLTRLWLNSYPELAEYRAQGLAYYSETAPTDHLILHWGMSLAVFPLFRDVVIQMGRLFSIQGFFRREEIRSRLLEKYSNLGTLPRSINRIIQTMQDWKTIQKQADGSYQAQISHIQSPSLEQWLITIAISSTPQKRILLNDLYRLPELFPFVLNTGNGIKTPATIRVERDGNNLEYLVIKQT